MQMCKTYNGSPPEVGIAELRGCVELARRLRVNLEIHSARDSNGIVRWYLQWIEATEERKGSQRMSSLAAPNPHSRDVLARSTRKLHALSLFSAMSPYCVDLNDFAPADWAVSNRCCVARVDRSRSSLVCSVV